VYAFICVCVCVCGIFRSHCAYPLAAFVLLGGGVAGLSNFSSQALHKSRHSLSGPRLSLSDDVLSSQQPQLLSPVGAGNGASGAGSRRSNDDGDDGSDGAETADDVMRRLQDVRFDTVRSSDKLIDLRASAVVHSREPLMNPMIVEVVLHTAPMRVSADGDSIGRLVSTIKGALPVPPPAPKLSAEEKAEKERKAKEAAEAKRLERLSKLQVRAHIFFCRVIDCCYCNYNLFANIFSMLPNILISRSSNRRTSIWM
jgi:hypothetical protein